MLNKKRVFVSLGASISILIGLFVTVLFSRALKGPEWISTVIVSIFTWPVWLFVYVFPIPYPGRVGSVVLFLSMGVVADLTIFFVLIYAVLSLFKRKSPHSSPPPPPFPFQ